MKLAICGVVGLLTALGFCTDARGQFLQQGPKLIATGALGTSQQGHAVAISADGNTALVGAPNDNNRFGAVWVWTRNASIWTQSAKLVGTNTFPAAQQGYSVALSADGNTALVGGCFDGNGIGAAWVFARSGGVWTQQGTKLAGADAVPTPNSMGFPNVFQGCSVALSADGDTALVGGYADSNFAGAAWVWTRSAGTWTQQGPKLAVAGNSGQGVSVALSGDGNTALIGSTGGDVGGGALVWTRSAGVWTSQGSKLVGTGGVGGVQQGAAVALSTDGNTGIVGDWTDNHLMGAAWIWTRTGGIWTQQGPKLVGTGAEPVVYGDARDVRQGISVALSADGTTAIVGGSQDHDGVGATWIWRTRNGAWVQKGAKLIGVDVVSAPQQGTSVALSADGHMALVGGYSGSDGGAAWAFVDSPRGDFDGDGRSDILWHHTSGATAMWLMDGTQVTASGGLGTIDPAWQIVGVGHLNSGSAADIIWQHTSGATTIWWMKGTQITGSKAFQLFGPDFQLAGTADYDGDSREDLLWRNGSGTATAVFMDYFIRYLALLEAPDRAWQIVGSGDYNGDFRGDLLWRHSSGALAMWLMNGTQVIGWDGIGTIDPAWQVAGSGDYNGDGFSDILWRHTSGALAMWLMNGTQVASSGGLGVIDPGAVFRRPVCPASCGTTSAAMPRSISSAG
jgi:hypothetical protein